MVSPVSPGPRKSSTRWSIADLVNHFGLDKRDPVEVIKEYGAWQRDQKSDMGWQDLDTETEAAALENGLDIVQIGFRVGCRCLVGCGAKLDPPLRWEHPALEFLRSQNSA